MAKLAHTARAYDPGFCSMKSTRSIATPPGRDASDFHRRLSPSILLRVPINLYSSLQPPRGARREGRLKAERYNVAR